MIEILILINLCRRLGANARAKGHADGWYQLLLVVFWFGAEIGMIFGVGLLILLAGGDDEQFLVAYAVGIAGAAFGAWGAFKIVASLPDLTHHDDEDDEHDEHVERRLESGPLPADHTYRASETEGGPR